MAVKPEGWLARPIRDRAARQWAGLSDAARGGKRLADPELRDEAATLRRDLGRFLQLSDPLAVKARNSLARMDLPPGTDWRWRPAMFCGPISPSGMSAPENGQRLGDQVALWHDCGHRSLILRQARNMRATDLAPFGMRLEVMAFSGSYLSLALDLPAEVLEGLYKHQIIRLEVVMQAERPLVVYGRMNALQGPNTAQMLRQLGDPIDDHVCDRVVEFDLAYAGLTERRIEKLWLDLIFEAPHMNAVSLTDAVFSRHPRAEM